MRDLRLQSIVIAILMTCSAPSFAMSDADEVKNQNHSRAIGAVMMLPAAGGAGTCTATLMCADVILSAAHCFDLAKTRENTFFLTDNNARKVLDEATANKSRNPCNYTKEPCAKITQYWAHPSYKSDGSTRRFDISLAKLSKPIQLKTYPTLATTLPQTCQEYGAVGYGRTDGKDPSSAFVKHSGVFEYKGNEHGLVTRNLGYIGTSKYKPSINATVIHRYNMVEEGDSGGPIFDLSSLEFTDGNVVIDKFKVYGVANNSTAPAPWLDVQGYYAPISPSLNLLLPQIKKMCGD